MKSILIASVLAFSVAAQSETLYYKGVSQSKSGGDCLVSLKKDQNTFTGFAIEGNGETWEILKENGSDYGPGKSEAYVEIRSFEPQAKVHQSNPLFSRDIVLETNFKVPDASIRANAKVRLYIENDQLVKVKAEQSFKTAYVIPLAKGEIICVELKQVFPEQ